jgi:hypothetical protein
MRLHFISGGIKGVDGLALVLVPYQLILSLPT